MRRRSILQWIGLTALSLAVVFELSTIVHEETAAAETRSTTGGSLQYIDKDGKPADCPLKHTEVKARVSGFLSRVTVTQDFQNNSENKIEAVYTFPLPQASAVDDLTMLIGDRAVKGKIMRREEAQQAYAAAKQIGKVASLLDQERPNIFTQQVANIMPGERVRIVISYVETLKYEDGSYEWSFPMVVAPRYIPAADPQQENPAEANAQSDASRISPPSPPHGTRAGHDISLEIDVDAGVPIAGVNSESHETEVQQINEKRAVVRLKDRATIPNKDFLLTYRVAGESINDAVLTHRSERGGFFTLILQPPQRVTAEDVMPKELIFVLDTSGSMQGFPIEKAKETMDLALNNLYPHDMFNLITFSGDTHILFPQPVFATPENLRKAKQFLAGRKGDGGTEMMKAIKAALEPSRSQAHVRIACFMTDGEVGNDEEILAEVQKYSNARVFAMGFGNSPNRYLLDKMSEYGRGEVDYVSPGGDTSAVARRFNERIRNPLLTDLSIDWSDLPVTDVYPKRIPDLFGAKPVILSGRYTHGSKGSIRLKGKLAGQDFVREIPVELPETEAEHGVLATLWGRRKIDDLTQHLLAQDQTVRDQTREEITQLGLNLRLMTQYTSFVAIDEVVFTGGEPPQRVDVPVESAALPLSRNVNHMGVAEVVTVQSSATTHTSVTRRAVQELPVQGRSFYSLVTLMPGATAAGPNTTNVSVNGHRGASNEFRLDGVSANFGLKPSGDSLRVSASGNVPASTASGGGNGIATLGAAEEFKVQMFGAPAEYGRAAGAQVEVITKSGTNDFHGSLFHFFGNDALDASDWFANSRGLKQPPKRLNLFGGTFGGPLRTDRTFFFASYEGMRLRQPMVGITDVPSLPSRAGASAALRPLLDAFPVPNGAPRSDGFAEFAASFANPARHDTGSLRIDHLLHNETTLHGHYHFADSDATLRGANGLSLNTANHVHSRSQLITGSMTHNLSATSVLDVRANYSRLRFKGSYLLDEFGGGVIPTAAFPVSSFTFDLNSRNAAWMFGDEQSSLQRQMNLVASVQKFRKNHLFKLGGDYRRLSPSIDLRASQQNVLFDNLDAVSTGVPTRISLLRFGDAQHPVFHNLSLFAQDEWQKSSRLTLTYGVRWELAPPPSTGERAFAVDQVEHPATLELAAPGSSLWKTRFLNLAPRLGVAYQLFRDDDEWLLRGGAGIVHDLSGDRSADIFASSIPFVSGDSFSPLIAFDPELRVPYVINWNVSLQKTLDVQSISASYVGSSGRRLLHTQTLLDQHPDFSFLRVTTNRGKSDYHALQLNLERPLTNGLGTRVSYTLGRSRDNVPDDSVRRVIIAPFNLVPSDFDVRHQLTGFATYELPAPFRRGIGNKLFRNWALDSIFNARSARPLKFVTMIPTSFGVAHLQRDLSKRGFPFHQVDIGLRRKFSFSEFVGLQFQADAFNAFNHPNFEDPLGHDLILGRAGQSTSMSGRSLAGGGFPSFYSFGGPRAMRFSVKLQF